MQSIDSKLLTVSYHVSRNLESGVGYIINDYEFHFMLVNIF